MDKFNFNSQVCTSRSQSERLLALGLKKETADMTWKFSHLMKGVPQYDCLAESTWDEDTIARYVQHCGRMNLTEHWKHPDGTQMSSEEVYAEITKKDIPAWSLHRLIEMMPKNIAIDGDTAYPLQIQKRSDGKWCVGYQGWYDCVGDLYDSVIWIYQLLISEDYLDEFCNKS